MTAPTPKLFVATPTTNGFMLSDYVVALMRMCERLRDGGIGFAHRTVDGPTLPVQRDMLADEFLQSDCTHFLLIDRDMGFSPDVAEKLLAFAKPVVGAAYASRALSLPRLKAAAAERSFEHALALSYDWHVRLFPGQLTVQRGFTRVAALGTGFLLVERGCLERLAADPGLPRYLGYHKPVPLRAFFRPMPQEGTAAIEQDFHFCERWAASGGEVWAYAAAQVRRVGEFAYGVPFRAYLDALRGSVPAQAADGRGAGMERPGAASGLLRPPPG